MGEWHSRPFREYLERDWKRIDVDDELQVLREDGQDVWVLYTFPIYLENSAPDLMARIRSECAHARDFHGTVEGAFATIVSFTHEGLHYPVGSVIHEITGGYLLPGKGGAILTMANNPDFFVSVRDTAEHVHGANLIHNEYGHPLFGDFFFFITGFHGTHVFSGVVLNFIVFVNVLMGTYEKRGHYEMIEKVGLYWHFVDLVWVFVFTFFYLV